ncbi:NADPH-dependent alpha-keto amide reductase-like [Vicia villosa]|uniref:NADPH-dependent alpha-keto amide reductase-like n=1 Tax=Vicia villosa TaxID=3911 RepID=UPI00273A91D7|nr:NADPH-dependent alpha-keto amide reductase-like [Vicia villosa]
MEVVQAIEKGQAKAGEGRSLIRRIRKITDLHNTAKLEHTYREANRCADALAKFGCTLDSESIVFETVPIFLNLLLENDANGVTASRVLFNKTSKIKTWYKQVLNLATANKNKHKSCKNHPHLVIPALQKSLKTLELDYLDLYFIHWPLCSQPGKFSFPIDVADLLPFDVKGVWESMEQALKLGLTKAIGVSNFSVKKLQKLLSVATVLPAVNQTTINIHIIIGTSVSNPIRGLWPNVIHGSMAINCPGPAFNI